MQRYHAGRNTGPSWRDLPEPLLRRILREAFRDSGAGLTPWLRMSGVCRSWKEIMSSNPVQVAFDAYMTEQQAAWLRKTSVPLRSIVFAKGPPAQAITHGWPDDDSGGDTLPGPMPALESPLPAQIVQNVNILGAPCCLIGCSSLREASLRLQVPCKQVGEVLAQLPASLGSLTVDIIQGQLPMTALGHMARLRTLTVEVDEPGSGLAVLPTPAPPPLRHLLIDGGSSWVEVSCPALRPGAMVQLRTDFVLRLTDAAAHLVGCRLDIFSPAIVIPHQGMSALETLHVGLADPVDHLFCWFRRCGADCIRLLPARGPEPDVFQPGRHFHVDLDTGEEQWCDLREKPDGTSEYVRELELHSAVHGFRFAFSKHDGIVVLTRYA